MCKKLIKKILWCFTEIKVNIETIYIKVQLTNYDFKCEGKLSNCKIRINGG